jgi:5-hydroxyisourate hydrolase
MATVSSHILDSVSGKSAAGIRCQLFQLDGDLRQPVFDVLADDEGRINESIPVQAGAPGNEFELVMHAADYFGATDAVVRCVVIRFVIDHDRRYHMPVMLAPHSCSTWWSN